MKKRTEKSITESSEQIIYSDGCRVERPRRRRTDRPGASKLHDQEVGTEEIVLNKDDFETIDGKLVKKIRNPYIILSLAAVLSLALGSYSLMQVSSIQPTIKAETSSLALAASFSKTVSNLDENVNREAVPLSEYSVKQMAELLITEQNWGDRYIDVFAEKLRRLDKPSLSKYADTKWFQNVAFLVESEIAEQALLKQDIRKQDLSNGEHDLTSMPQQPLIKLAVVMGVALSEYGQDQYEIESSSIVKILDETKAAVFEENEQIERSAKKPESLFTEADINKVLDQYVAAYKVGNTDKLLGLFMFDGVTELAAIGELKKHLEKTFKKSSKRNVDFNDLDWQIEGDTAVGTGQYNAKIVLKRGRGTETISARTQITLQFLQDKLLLADLKLMGPKVDVVKAKKLAKKTKLAKRHKQSNKRLTQKPKKTKKKTITPKFVKNNEKPKKRLAVVEKKPSVKAKMPVFAVADSSNSRVKFPTKAELNVVVEKFVKAYDKGDINMLGSLFAENAKTNDQNNLKEIRQEYADLFSKTANRQIHIKALNWTFHDNLAKGEGNLKVVVVSTVNSKAQVVNGTIQIKAKKYKNKVLITHLYHKQGTSLGVNALNN